MTHAIIVGTGNVASHLATALKPHFQKLIIAGRSQEKASELALKAGLSSTSIQDMPANADVYFLAVSDDGIPKVASSIKVSGLVVHTSGSVAMRFLKNTSARIGVFYPLQSFSKERTPDWRNIPILIESNNQADSDFLYALGRKLSDTAERVSSAQRASLHIAAVFANNFTNYMIHISQDLLNQSELPQDLLNPLMLETVKKAVENGAFRSQTGPAKRQDVLTMQRHIEALSDAPEYKKVYALLSEQIRKLHGRTLPEETGKN
jgi:predicted short-subunit dehydrogenase-like oxidoreductase (DUF2520 family)